MLILKFTNLLQITSRNKSQKTDETVVEYYTRLQLLAKKCEFGDVNIEVKRQIIQGTTSARLRRKAIEQSLSLEDLLKAARAMETADEQTGEMEKHHTNAIHKTYRNRQSESLKQKKKSYQGKARTLKNNQCGLCGGSYPHVGDCPAQVKKFTTVVN